MGEIQEKQHADGLKPTKYILGDKEVDGHTHEIYLRDDLPIATTSALVPGLGFHAHSILEGLDGTLICVAELGHTHTNLVVEDVGSYALRTMFNV